MASARLGSSDCAADQASIRAISSSGIRLRRKQVRVPTCSFCGEPGSTDRLLVGDEDAIICEDCIALAVARIAEARAR